MKKMLRAFRLALALALMCGFVMPVTKSVASEFKVFQVKISAPMPEALEIRKDFYINGGTTHCKPPDNSNKVGGFFSAID